MQHTETTTIDRPAEEVWSFIGDIRWWPKWIDEITDVEVPSGEMAEGTQLSYKFRGRPSEPTITGYEDGRMIGISASEKGYEFAESISLRPNADQTEVVFTMGFEPTVWWLKVLAVAIAPFKSTFMGRSMRREMGMLKSAVEASDPEEA